MNGYLYGERPRWRLALPDEPGGNVQIIDEGGCIVASIQLHSPDEGGPLDPRAMPVNAALLVEILTRGGVRP